MTHDISESDVFVLLSSRRRRLALRVLAESSVPLDVTTLAERVGRREAEDRRRVALSLHHQHLPKLEAAAVVRFDREDGTVYPDRNFDLLLEVLDDVDERDEPWSSD